MELDFGSHGEYLAERYNSDRMKLIQTGEQQSDLNAGALSLMFVCDSWVQETLKTHPEQYLPLGASRENCDSSTRPARGCRTPRTLLG